MRHTPLILTLSLILPLHAQETPVSPTEDLKATLSEWTKTMREIQKEENDWNRDQEVLANYKEGLEKEIIDLKEKIAEAKTRKDGGDSESLAKSKERDLFLSSNDQLSAQVRTLEESMTQKIPLIPTPLRNEPKVIQALEDLQKNLQLAPDLQKKTASKRLLNLINLSSEIEKFQQTVVLRNELHKDKSGGEFNMKVVYFGLATAYAVNEEKTLALVGRPDPKSGWVFEERKDLIEKIAKLIEITTGDTDAAFEFLPFSKQ